MRVGGRTLGGRGEAGGRRWVRGRARVAVPGSGPRSRGAEGAPQVGPSETHPNVPKASLSKQQQVSAWSSPTARPQGSPSPIA